MKYKIQMLEEFDCNTAIEDAFDYIVDFSNIHEWDHTVISSKKVTGADVGLGTTFALILAMGAREVPLTYEITEFDSPNKPVLRGISTNFTAVDTVRLTRAADGCNITWQADLEFTGVASLLVRLMAKKMKTSGAKTIRDLETKLTNRNSG